MAEEFFGPLLTMHVYDDADWSSVLTLVDATGPYALTCSIFAADRTAISEALGVLRDAAGMTYVNDKTGSPLAPQRWISPRFIDPRLDRSLIGHPAPSPQRAGIRSTGCW
ncbi:hypothetical protein [Streptomyces sp. UG1]|uniref:hypothetical protein n=1 Tax=Streptomyces sp. UG1 TaxID=3417652 RepID=UPI003CF62CF4